MLIGGASPATAAAQEAGGETSEVEVRVVARRLEGSRVEFGLQQRGADGSWGERLLPSRRFLPTGDDVGTWLASSRLVLSVGLMAFDDPGDELDVRIVARRLEGSRVEFGLQQRGADGSWGERLLPSRRFLPTGDDVGTWLASSSLSLGAAAPGSGRIETPQESRPGPAATRIAASGYHTCAVTADGDVDCWGDNSLRFRLGDPSVYVAMSPIPALGVRDAVAVTIGDSASGTGDGHTCVLHEDQTVSCWGSDSEGVLGQGTPGSPVAQQEDPTGGDPTVPVVRPASGLAVPTKVPGIGDAVDVTAGARFTCVVHADGTASCWGSNVAGSLGDGTQQSRDWPQKVTGLSDLVGIAAGWGHACGLHAGGSVSCWGGNYDGQLGDGTRSSRSSPTKVKDIDDAVAVSAGGGSSCAVRRSGEVSCWGRNTSWYYGASGDEVREVGILGTGSRSSMEPLPAAVLGITDAVAVDIGAFSSCVLHRGGGVSCWGANHSGQLGTGTAESRLEPVRLDIRDALAVTVSSRNGWSGSHACAVTAGDGVLCWGDNRYGQLGVGDTDARQVPSRVATPGGGGDQTAGSTVIPTLRLPDWDDVDSMIDAGPFRAAMDGFVQQHEAGFPWLRTAWNHVREDVRLFDEAGGGTTTVSCGFFEQGEFECRTSKVTIGTRLNRLSMRELVRIGVHELAHVYDHATAFTPDRAWGAVQLYFAVTYPRCTFGGTEAIADAMLHLVDPDAFLTYYGPLSACPETPVRPTEEDLEVLRSGLAGEVPGWYTEYISDGADLWRAFLDSSGDLTLLSNIMHEFGGLCRTDFLMNWTIAPPRSVNPFRDGGC